MINVSSATKTAYLSGSGGKQLVVSFPDLDLIFTNNDIVDESLTLYQAIETENVLTFRGCNASKLEIELKDFEQDVRGENIVVTITAGNTDTITLFDGIVDEQNNITHVDETVKLTAYDRLYFVSQIDVTGWYADLNFPMTVKQFRDSFFSYIGVIQDSVTLPCDDLQMVRMVSADVLLNARTVMESICQANARYGMMRGDFFSYIALSKAVETELTMSNYSKVDYDPYVMSPITKVSILDDSGVADESYGSGDNILTIQGNFVAYSVNRGACAEIIYREVSGITMNSARLNLVGLPYLECGDYITLPTSKNGMEMFILSRTLKGTQGLSDSFISTVDHYQHETEGVANALLRQSGRINHFYRDLEETKSTVELNKQDADGKFIEQQTQITQNATAITAEVTRATGAENTLSSRITQTADSLTLQIQEIQAELDGDVTVYYREGEPTLLNYPAWDFTYNIPCNGTVKTTNDLKFVYTDEYYQRNVRSIVYDTESNLTYRFDKEDGVFFWRPISNTEFGIAMEKIAELEVTTESISASVSEVTTELHGSYYTKNETDSKISISANGVLSTVSQNYTNSADLSANYATKSSLQQTASQISATVETKVSQTGGSSSSFGWSLTASAFDLYSGSNRVFRCNSSGIVVDGTIYAKGGTVGGWNISPTQISSGNVTISSSGNIECTVNGSTRWKLGNDGSLVLSGYATSGDISALSGRIGTIETNYITADNINAKSFVLTAGHIGNLDASKITSGTINANRIDVNTLASTSFASGRVNVGSLRVGLPDIGLPAFTLTGATALITQGGVTFRVPIAGNA